MVLNLHKVRRYADSCRRSGNILQYNGPRANTTLTPNRHALNKRGSDPNKTGLADMNAPRHQNAGGYVRVVADDRIMLHHRSGINHDVRTDLRVRANDDTCQDNSALSNHGSRGHHRTWMNERDRLKAFRADLFIDGNF